MGRRQFSNITFDKGNGEIDVSVEVLLEGRKVILISYTNEPGHAFFIECNEVDSYLEPGVDRLILLYHELQYQFRFPSARSKSEFMDMIGPTEDSGLSPSSSPKCLSNSSIPEQ